MASYILPDAPLPGLLPRPWPDSVPDEMIVLLLPLGVQVLTTLCALALVPPGGVLLDHLLGLGGALLVLVTLRALALVLPGAPRALGLVRTALHRGVPDAPLPGLLPCPWPDMVPDDLVVLLLPLGFAVLILVAALALITALALVLVLSALRRDVPDVPLSSLCTRPLPNLDPVNILLPLGVAALSGGRLRYHRP